jgi:cyclopropane-fatty-acyl-phospholipid synthase
VNFGSLQRQTSKPRSSGLTPSPARALFLRRLRSISDGHLTLRLPGGAGSTQSVHEFGDPSSSLHAVVEVRDPGVFRRFILGGDIAFGETYAEGRWTSPDLPSVVRLAVRNIGSFDAGRRLTSTISRYGERLRHALRRNTVKGSRLNIRYHYDLGTDFYSLFLDPTLMYSCAVFETPDATLEEAQRAKLDRIAQALELAPGDRVLEIGSGWGTFAIHAATRYGCRVTTTTISRSQHDYVKERLARENAAGRVELLFEDYRRLRGRYDKIVSIEMFEAVGLAYYDRFFSAVDRLLAPGGAMLLQTIWMNEAHFSRYHRQPDFIQRHIFPGSELASLAEIRKSLARATALSIAGVDEIGLHYATTLAAWRERFLANRERVLALGFPETFVRMWDYYLAYCEGAFAEKYIGDAQILLVKVGAARASESRTAGGLARRPA